MNRSERITTLDILRGLALFGMILVHFHQRMEIPAEGIEDSVGWVIWMGVETKAWATFALLFGAGFAILMRRLEARGLPVAAVFLRRMLALAVFGVLVEILFGFSILLEYAIWGVPLLLVRKWPTRALLALAFAAAIAPRIYGTIHPYDHGPYYERLHLGTGGYGESVSLRIANLRWTYAQARAVIPTSSFVLFLLGLLAVRHRLFEDPGRMRRTIVGAMAFGFLSWTLAWFVLPKLRLDPFFGIISDQWLALTYVGGVVLLLAWKPVWKDRLSPFEITGRMALTNYVLQAAIISWLASGYGAGLKIRPYLELPATILVFALMVTFSRLWFSRFAYGPLERLWRSFTYFSWPRPAPVTT